VPDEAICVAATNAFGTDGSPSVAWPSRLSPVDETMCLCIPLRGAVDAGMGAGGPSEEGT